MKISLAEMNSNLDTAEEKASSNRKYPKWSSEKNKAGKIKRPSEIYGTIKTVKHTCIPEETGQQEKKNEEIMVKIFSDLRHLHGSDG